MEHEAMSKEQFLEKLSEKLRAMKEAGFDVELTQGENPWSMSVSIGKEGAEPQTIGISMYSHVANGYERGFDAEVVSATVRWSRLIDEAHAGHFDAEQFCDSASFAFEKLIESANEETISRRDAYLALKIKEFADIAAEGSE